MSIPDEAVEAAARALVPEVWGPRVWQYGLDGESPTETRDRVQKHTLRLARAALEAAAPHLHDAWRDDELDAKARQAKEEWVAKQ